MGENEGSKIFLILAIIAIALIIIIIFGYILPVSQFQGVVPVHPVSPPAPTPTTAPANVILSPNEQVVVISLYQSPRLSVTINQNGNGGVNFPCSVTFYYTIPDIYGRTSDLQTWEITHYGTFSGFTRYPRTSTSSENRNIILLCGYPRFKWC
jgi:hypothetical protein